MWEGPWRSVSFIGFFFNKKKKKGGKLCFVNLEGIHEKVAQSSKERAASASDTPILCFWSVKIWSAMPLACSCFLGKLGLLRRRFCLNQMD